MHELIVQAGVKGISERSELIPVLSNKMVHTLNTREMQHMMWGEPDLAVIAVELNCINMNL